MNYINKTAAMSGNMGQNAGQTPDYFPIAMAYVPWQVWEQPYPLEQGFNRGTIFPELDLPFVMGRCM